MDELSPKARAWVLWVRGAQPKRRPPLDNGVAVELYLAGYADIAWRAAVGGGDVEWLLIDYTATPPTHEELLEAMWTS